MRFMNGQVFTRDAGEGLTMVVGIFQRDPDIPDEHLYVAHLEVHEDTGQDHTELAHGMGIGNMLTEPIWQVRREL